MKTTVEFLDAVRARHGLTSDYQLAKFLGMRTSTISRYRNEQTMMDEAMCLKIAAALDISDGEVLVAIAHEREKRPEVKRAWERVSKRLAGAAGAGLVALVLTGAPSPAPAAILHNSFHGTTTPPADPIYTYATTTPQSSGPLSGLQALL